MINQLLANLAFTPSLITQISFYAGRLRKEASIRRLGLFLIAFSLLVQMFAAMVPVEKSLAYSDNHIINGVKTRDDILRAWDTPRSDVPAIYSKFGVTRDDIARLPSRPNVTIKSTSADYWSIGRNSLSGYSNVQQQYKHAEMAVETGGPTVYIRPLHAWDTRYPYSNYAAFQGKKSTGETFWILVDCGNYTQIGAPKPKNPALEVKKSIPNKPQKLKAGDSFTYRIEYRNKVPDSVANNVVIEDKLDLASYEITSPKNLPIVNGKLEYKIGNLPYTKTFHVLDIKVKLKDSLSSGTSVCNVASLKSSNGGTASSSGTGACVEVFNPCPFNPELPNDGKDCIEPQAACALTNYALNPATREVTLNTKVSTNNAKSIAISSYSYDFGDGSPASTIRTSALENQIKHVYPVGNYKAQVTVNYTIKGVNGSSKKAICSAPIEIQPEQPVGQSKSVRNITQNTDAEESQDATVHANDVLEYSLVATNSQAYERTFTIEDYVGDILDYAEIDQAHLVSQGGTFDAQSKKIIWAGQKLPANQDTVKTFRVKMKDPLPSTNSPSNVSTNFDCKISNKYGNEISMDVACPVIKNIESLPNTGPGLTLATGFAIAVVSGYFFARSRLLAKELNIIKYEAVAGGM